VAVAAAVVLRDVLVPTFVLLVVAALSLVVRRERPSTLGFHRLGRPWRSAFQILGLTVAWTVLQIALLFPLLEHATGQKQDVSDFAHLQGNLVGLLVLLALTWTYAAFGEELVFRGYLQTRVTDVLGTGVAGVVTAVLLSSAMFGLIHAQQGLVGVVATFLDALFFSVLRLRYRTVLASSFAHGFNNTIGLVAFFLVGPIYGLW